MHSPRACGAWLVALALALLGCARTTNLASSVRPEDSGTPDAGQGLDAEPGVDAGLALCGNAPCECDNGEDDDRDGLTDGLDPECTGPYDQDESSFATGEIPNGNPRCADCFFDGNPGPEDGCRVPTSCSIDGTPANGMGCSNSCVPTDTCIASCQVLTPNGCDCFGCCDVLSGGSVVTILLADTCSLKSLDDPLACQRCRQSNACKNECGRCELCPGRTLLDLPSDCPQTNGIRYTCDNGRVCGDKIACPDRFYCAQGCCVPVIL